jgi:hypothetical protein
MSKSIDYFSSLNGSTFAPSSTERAFIQVVQGPAGTQGDSGADGYAVYYGMTAPASTESFEGLVWIKTNSGKGYVYLSTENSSQFVDIFTNGESVNSLSEFNFPTGPLTGDIYAFENREWKWSGSAWDYISSASGGNINLTIGLTAPTSVYGSFWYDLSGSALLIGIRDSGGNEVFVEA